MIQEEVLPDAESVRRRELIQLQEELQRIWDKIEYLEWFASRSKKNEDKIQRLWEEYEQLEILERETLRRGSMMLFCSSCGDHAWDSQYSVKSKPYCESCYHHKVRR